MSGSCCGWPGGGVICLFIERGASSPGLLAARIQDSLAGDWIEENQPAKFDRRNFSPGLLLSQPSERWAAVFLK